MLKMTDVELELLSDVDMHLFIERGIRGMAMISNRYAKANNPLLPDQYDENKKTTQTSYITTEQICTVRQWSNLFRTAGFVGLAKNKSME